jgi:dipeptidyl aminopeptidase/acylaminoacyl peptidase
MVPFADGDPVQFSSGAAADTDPRWSPDGQRVAFFSDRVERGKSSLYVMPVSGGEAVRVFEEQGDLDGLTWSPDGSRLAVLFTEPETEAEKKRKEERDDANVWDKEHKFQRLWVIDPATKKAKCISPPGQQVWHYAWSQDGTRIAFNTTPTPRIDDTLNTTRLSIVSRDGGVPATVLTPLGDTADLVWSACGKKLAWIGPAGRVRSGEWVYAVPVDGGEVVCLTPGLEATVESLSAIGDGSRLLVQTAEGLGSGLFEVDWNGERTALLGSGKSHSIPHPVTADTDGNRFAMIRQSGSQSPDVWTFGRGAPEPTRRTHLNPELEAAALGTPEQFCWKSCDGTEVSGLLFRPFGVPEDAPAPLVVQVHGGPTSRWANEFTANWHDWGQSLAGRGIAVLMPNPRGSTGRGPSFTNALMNEVGHGEFQDIMAGVDALIERGIADPQRVGIGGWSWGGYMTAWTVTQTDRFKAAVMGAGLANMVSDNGIGDIPSANLSYFEASLYDDPEPYWARSPIKYITNVKTPTLILHGEADQRVAMQQGMEFYTALRLRGVETQFVTYPREGHAITETKHQKDLIERVVGWFTRHLLEETGDPA